MADEGFKVVHRYYITDQKGEINEETPFFDKIEDKPLWDCLYCVEKNGKKGIINLQTGKIVLEPIYEVIKEIPSQYISPRYALLKWRDSEDRTWHGVYELARATGVITRLSETSTRTEYELTCQMRKQFYLTQDYDVWEPNGWDRKDNLLKVIKGQKRGFRKRRGSVQGKDLPGDHQAGKERHVCLRVGPGDQRGTFQGR